VYNAEGDGRGQGQIKVNVLIVVFATIFRHFRLAFVNERASEKAREKSDGREVRCFDPASKES
jgi:hypothetical protein